jgi:DNA invertase Pin-like site-specific DNA recombinase
VAKIGYARVSTADQDLALQLDALNKAGCERIFEEKASGAKADRPKLAETLAFLRPDDTLVVWRLDRLGRSLKHLIETVTSLEDQGVAFQSLTEGFDTSTPGGRLVFHFFGALAEFERALIRERTIAGLIAARARGRIGGRPRVLTPEQVRQVRRMQAEADNSVQGIADVFGVSRATIYRALETEDALG